MSRVRISMSQSWHANAFAARRSFSHLLTCLLDVVAQLLRLEPLGLTDLEQWPAWADDQGQQGSGAEDDEDGQLEALVVEADEIADDLIQSRKKG